MRFLFGFTLIFILGLASKPVSALTISPVRIEMSGDADQVLHGELTLFNEQGEAKTFYSSAENFESRGESGAPFFLPDRIGLATWINIQEQVTLAPQEQKIIPFNISIPKDAEPGGYFSAILWGQTPSRATESGQVVVGGKLGILVLLKVSGEIEEGGGLVSFSTKNKQRFLTAAPVIFAYSINNSGGDRIVPKGELKIKNTFRLTSSTLLANKNEGSVLPNSTRRFEILWGQDNPKNTDLKKDSFYSFFTNAVKKQWGDFHLGWYTAELNTYWGETVQTANVSYNFFVLPWQLLSVILIILFVLGFVGKIVIKKYNRWIIAQAMQQK